MLGALVRNRVEDRLSNSRWDETLISDAWFQRHCEYADSGELPEEERDLAASEGVTPKFKEWLLREYRSLNRLTADELVELYRRAGFEIIWEHRGQRSEEPPIEICEQYLETELRTNEIRLLARRSV